MNKKTIIAVIIVLVVLGIWWMYAGKPANAPTTEVKPAMTQDEFSQELNGLDEASVTQEFQEIDAGINQL